MAGAAADRAVTEMPDDGAVRLAPVLLDLVVAVIDYFEASRAPSHPGPDTLPSSRFGQLPGERVTYTKVSRIWWSRSSTTWRTNTIDIGTSPGSSGSERIYGRRTS